MDVFAATLVSTASAPQSATVVLEGADAEFDALTYTVVSGPSNGTLSDPNNGDAAVSTGAIAGQTLTYTPTTDYTGTDTFTYRVNDGVSDSTTTYTATITVFDAVRAQAKQIGPDIDGEAAADASGASVALSSDGQTLAVGAPYNDGNGSDAGHVRVYAWNGSAWTRMGADIDGYSELGVSVALSSDGKTLAVGEYEYDMMTSANNGRAMVYAWNGSAWTPRDSVLGDWGDDYAGFSLALSSDGQTLAVGSPGHDSASGHVRVYAWNGSIWKKKGGDIDGEAMLDFSGTSVALSSDGQTLAVGAPYNDGNGSLSGHVRVYAWDGSAWTRMVGDINGEAAGVESGYSVALSSDGQTVAMGGPFFDSVINAGHVRVYDLTKSAPGISGTPNLAAVPGVPYQAFDDSGTALDPTERLTVSDPDPADTLTFSATAGGGALPAWLTVDTATGALSGIPSAGDVGVVTDVVLTVSDGELSTALPGFNLAVLLDTDADGQPDDCDAACLASGYSADTDDDGDGDNDGADNCPLIANADQLDTDSDGTGDACDTDDDGDGDNDGADNCPLIANADQLDTDSDGTGDACDTDDDNDLVDDGFDACPSTPSQEAVDAQGCSETQKDDDSDDVNNADDSCPNTPAAETGQVNTEGCGPSERDTDGDGVTDNLDAFPNNPNETLDSDGDGYGDNEEISEGTDPNDPNDQPVQGGLPIWLLYEAAKP